MHNKICYINGSPRTSNCLSEFLINTFKVESEKYYEEQTVVKATDILKKEDMNNDLMKIIDSNTIVIVTPIYIDSLPGDTMKFIEVLGEYISTHKSEQNKDALVYVCVNSGFIDTMQSKNLIRCLKFFTEKVNFKWGGAISLGAGELFKVDKEQKCHTSDLMKDIYDGFERFEKKLCMREVITENNQTILVSEKYSEDEFRELSNKSQAQIAASLNMTEDMLYGKGEL